MLQDRLNKILQKAAIYKTAYDEHAKVSSNLGAGLKSPSATKTEIGDTFFAHLLKLGDEVSESKYRQTLTQEQIDLKLKAEDIKTEIVLITRQLKGLKKPQKVTAGISIAEIYDKTINDFSNLIHSYDQLMELARKHALSNNGALFETVNSEAEITSINKIQLKRVLISIIVALIVGGMIGTFISLLRKTKH